MKKSFLFFSIFILNTACISSWELPLLFNISLQIPNDFARPYYDEQKPVLQHFADPSSPMAKETFMFTFPAEYEAVQYFILPNPMCVNADNLAKLIINLTPTPIKILSYSTKNTNDLNAAHFIAVLVSHDEEDEDNEDDDVFIISCTVYTYMNKAIIFQHSAQIEDINDQEKGMNQINALIALNPEYLNF